MQMSLQQIVCSRVAKWMLSHTSKGFHFTGHSANNKYWAENVNAVCVVSNGGTTLLHCLV